ncbi:MAG TPA: hypothetical protein VGA02_04795 [Gemmatimonadales bacterium]|jgi:uncharacterized small protein (DUF1192 family)
MSKQIRIQLTDAQKQQIEQATGRKSEALEMSVEELEERIAPMRALRPEA